MTCYSHTIDPKGVRHDSFCLGSPARVELDRLKFNLDCDLDPSPKNNHDSSAPTLRSFPRYWYETGPSYLFQHFINVKAQQAASVTKHALPFNSTLPTVILVKREIANFNVWHNLLEVMSVTHSLDVISMDKGTSTMWESPNRHNIHILILDDLEDGPYHELWNILTPNPVLRASDLAQIPVCNVVVPIPGGANPFWQGDWVDLECTQSSLLSTFTRRILEHFDLFAPSTASSPHNLKITVIDRVTKRRLLHQDELMAALKDALPEHNIQLVDFATLPFRDQLATVRYSDVLVGVHGAGLTHGMFLPSGSAIVEFMPLDLEHRGFRNMARMLGHSYHGVKTIKSNIAETKGDWQSDDVEVDQNDFLRELANAVDNVAKQRTKAQSRLDALLHVWD